MKTHRGHHNEDKNIIPRTQKGNGKLNAYISSGRTNQRKCIRTENCKQLNTQSIRVIFNFCVQIYAHFMSGPTSYSHRFSCRQTLIKPAPKQHQTSSPAVPSGTSAKSEWYRNIVPSSVKTSIIGITSFAQNQPSFPSYLLHKPHSPLP